jgi:hypothetical protein
MTTPPRLMPVRSHAAASTVAGDSMPIDWARNTVPSSPAATSSCTRAMAWL